MSSSLQSSAYPAIYRHEQTYDHNSLAVAKAVHATIFGDGRHGVVTLAAGGGSTISGVIAWDSTLSCYYTLIDFQPYNLTLGAGVTLEARGWRIAVHNILDLTAGSCTISVNGRNASGITGGAGHPPVSISTAINAGGGGGANGTRIVNTSVAGTSNSNVASTVRLGGVGGGNSGGARTNAAGSGGASPTTGTAFVEATYGQRKTLSMLSFIAYGTVRGLGGLGGPSGAGRAGISPAYADRGAGGGAAGMLFLSARSIKTTSTSKITANGGHGADAVVNLDACAGGGVGGGGGYVCVIASEISTGTLYIEAKGGDGGDGATVNTSSLFRDGDGGSGGNGGYIEYYIGSGTISTNVSGGAYGIGYTVGVGGTAINGTAGSAGTVVSTPVTS